MKFIHQYFSIIFWSGLVILDAVQANYTAAVTAVVVVVLLFSNKQHDTLITDYKVLLDNALDQIKAQQLIIEQNTRVMKKAVEELKKLKFNLNPN